MTTFNDLALAAPLARALEKEGHTAPTPIQAQAIPPAMAGSDVLGIAQTGTGKTAAFTLPILHRLHEAKIAWTPKQPKTLMLAPTRELAVQIEERVRAYGSAMRVRSAIIIGGVPHSRQRRAMAGGVDVLVATPGRLVDMMDQGMVDLSGTTTLVLDEADQMLDMGFIKPIQRIRRAMPRRVHTFLFSATMPKEIERFAAEMLTDPVRVEVTPIAKTADKVEQSVLFVTKGNKPQALAGLLSENDVERALVFSRTKHGADKIVKQLDRDGIAAAAIHGNKSQNARQRVLGQFAEGKIPVLVATDIAARGIDVSGITHVVQYDLPEVAEAYVHRIGRTARAGKTGVAVAFCSADELDLLRAVEKLTRQAVPVAEGSVSIADLGPPEPKAKPTHRKGQGRSRSQGQGQKQGRPQGQKRGGKPGGGRRSGKDGRVSKGGQRGTVGAGASA